FSLRSAEEVIDRVGFHNIGKEAKANLIAMSIDDGIGVVTNTEDTQRDDLDLANDAIVVVFNGAAETQSITIRTAAGFALHATQQDSRDDVVQDATFAEGVGGDGTFTVPARTTAVFVKAQGAAQGEGLSAFVTAGFEPPVPYGDTDIYLRGQFNGWGTGNRLTYLGGGSYDGFVTLEAGDYAFKIASADWSTVDIAAPEGQGVINLGEPATLSAAGRLPNLSISIAAAGEYRFVLDALDSDAPILTVTNARALPVEAFVRGTINGWSTDDPLLYVGKATTRRRSTSKPATSCSRSRLPTGRRWISARRAKAARRSSSIPASRCPDPATRTSRSRFRPRRTTCSPWPLRATCPTTKASAARPCG
ncbi:MAG: DUF3372 domain-containing protein, partial [Gammaproteobacteria bacterium]|nr:DUF3372 domain-containing protein [Gammaproteobacteria bacterium]